MLAAVGAVSGAVAASAMVAPRVGLDWFAGAPRQWRDEAGIRARIVRDEHGDEAMAYARRRLSACAFGSFQARRWRYIIAVLRSGRLG